MRSKLEHEIRIPMHWFVSLFKNIQSLGGFLGFLDVELPDGWKLQVTELNSHFDKCQQLLNSISGSLGSKTMVKIN